MLVELGNYSLSAAVLAAVGAVFASAASVRFDSAGYLRAARWLMVALTGLLTIASGLLLYAMVTSDFRLAYVAHYSERALPIGYKMAAFWAGQSGSLLLWAWILGVMNLVLVWVQRRENRSEQAGTIAVMAVVTGFFAILMLFAPGTERSLSANPFQALPVVPADGYGLNPMLQNAGMMAHPPLMFIGYAGYTYPFAIWMAAMFIGRRDNEYLKRLHRWNLFAWIFLSAGILWGAEWAYKELGWGGYWAWDPVENASLLPWLTGTALIHAIIMQRQRGMFKMWTAGLVTSSFILCIVGTYLTRSGVVASVHSFGEHPIGDFLFAFIALSVLFSAGVIFWRRRMLQPEHRIDRLLSREGAFLGIMVLLTAAMLLVLIGTIFPVLTHLVKGEQITVGEPFYNKVVVPIAMALVALMVIAPLLKYDRNRGKFLRALAIPAAAGVIAAVALWAVWGITEPWALLTAVLIVPMVLAVLIDVGRSAWTRARQMNENVVAAFFRLADGNHRRYGAWVVHLGVAMMVVGIAGSSLFDVKETHQLSPGQTAAFGRYHLTFNGLTEERRSNYTAVVADVIVTDDKGRTTEVKPERRFFDKAENAYSEVALRRSLKQDLYLTLAGWENGGRITAIQTIVNPLVNWIWIGAVVLCLGGFLPMLPRLFGTAKQAEPVSVEPLEINGVELEPRQQPRRSRRRRQVPAASA
jgi:cytochrome c-type biogenesis protein CcmF